MQQVSSGIGIVDNGPAPIRPNRPFASLLGTMPLRPLRRSACRGRSGSRNRRGKPWGRYPLNKPAPVYRRMAQLEWRNAFSEHRLAISLFPDRDHSAAELWSRELQQHCQPAESIQHGKQRDVAGRYCGNRTRFASTHIPLAGRERLPLGRLGEVKPEVLLLRGHLAKERQSPALRQDYGGLRENSMAIEAI